MKREKFKNSEKDIINALYRTSRPLTTSQISKKSDLSWNTTKKYLTKLYDKQYLRKAKKGMAVYWWLRKEK